MCKLRGHCPNTVAMSKMKGTSYDSEVDSFALGPCCVCSSKTSGGKIQSSFSDVETGGLIWWEAIKTLSKAITFLQRGHQLAQHIVHLSYNVLGTCLLFSLLTLEWFGICPKIGWKCIIGHKISSPLLVHGCLSKNRNLFTSERRSGIEAVNAEWMPVIKASAVLILAWNSAFFYKMKNESFWKKPPRCKILHRSLTPFPPLKTKVKTTERCKSWINGFVAFQFKRCFLLFAIDNWCFNSFNNLELPPQA